MKKAFFLILFCTCLVACKDECDDSDCPANRIYLEFEPVDSQGEKLLEMPDSIYSKDSVTLKPDNSPLVLHFASSKVVLKIDLSIKKFIIDFSRNKVDTFYVNSIAREDECCGTVVGSYALSNQDSVICDPCLWNTIKVIVP